MPQFFETYRAVVTPEQCDHLGHWNIQYYVGAISEAAIALSDRLGVSLEESGRRGLGLAAVHMELDYLRELRDGDSLRVETALVALGGKSLRVRHRMRNLTLDVEAFTASVTAVFLDLKARRAIEIPADIRTTGEALLPLSV